MSLFSILNPAKDFALEVAVKLWFNHTHKNYGTMSSIHIDSTAKSIRVELELKGETSPIHINVGKYELTTVAGETLIALGEVQTSREWINQLINDYLPPDKRCFKVPSAVKVLL